MAEKTKQETKQDKRAAALRENLRKRKALAKAKNSAAKDSKQDN